MIVCVRLFARARDLAGTDVIRVELPDRAAVADLRRQLAADHPALASLLERSALAVENEFAADSLLLSPDAEIALLPPVSGGQRDQPVAQATEEICRSRFRLVMCCPLFFCSTSR